MLEIGVNSVSWLAFADGGVATWRTRLSVSQELPYTKAVDPAGDRIE
jgi:hypothetical protein